MTVEPLILDYRDGDRTSEATIVVHGPAISVEFAWGEEWGLLAIGASPTGIANAVITTWVIPGMVNTRELRGTNKDIEAWWALFLGVLPPGLAEELAARRQSLGFI